MYVLLLKLGLMADMAPALSWTCRMRTSFLHPLHAPALSFSDSFSSSPLAVPPLRPHQQNQKQSFSICSVATTTTSPPPRRRPAIDGRKKKPRYRGPIRKLVGVREAILKPPLDDKRLAERFLQSPQLTLKSLPLLSSCLPPAPLRPEDHEWMEDNLPEVKEALGYPLEGMQNSAEDSPLFHLDTLLYLAFQHAESSRSKKAKYVRIGHSRLWLLGQNVIELALAEYFLQRYPREMPACIRERVFGMTSKKVLPRWIQLAGLDGIIFPEQEMRFVNVDIKQQTCRAVFWALLGAAYLSMGMREVYRILFEVFSLDPDAKSCQPKPRIGREDEDNVFYELDKKQMTWQDVASCKTEEDALFAKPLLFRACVPPGMQRFRGNLWEIDSLPTVLQILGYPLPSVGEDLAITTARNAELELGLQLCFLHPSMYKFEHPRFCNERFEYLGQKIQDVVMAEKLLMKHLDGPGIWLQEKHRKLLFNRVSGKYLREKKLHNFILYGDSRKELIEKARRLRNFSSVSVSQALHGVAYAVYGKTEVRRLMFQFLDFERLQTPP